MSWAARKVQIAGWNRLSARAVRFEFAKFFPAPLQTPLRTRSNARRRGSWRARDARNFPSRRRDVSPRLHAKFAAHLGTRSAAGNFLPARRACSSPVRWWGRRTKASPKRQRLDPFFPAPARTTPSKVGASCALQAQSTAACVGRIRAPIQRCRRAAQYAQDERLPGRRHR